MGEGLWKKLQNSKDTLIENFPTNTELTEATKQINNSASQVASGSLNAINEATGEVTSKLIEVSDVVFAKTDNLTDKASQVVSTVTETAGNSISKVANQSVDVLTQTTGEVTNKLIEASDVVFTKTDNLTDKASQVVSTVTETAGNSISKVANQSVDVLTQTTGEVTDKLTEVSNQALVNIDYLTDKAFSTATQTAEKAQSSLNETLQQTEQFHNSLTHIVQDPIDFAIKSLISNHPIITWFLGHPLLTAIVVIVFVLLFLSTINMIIQLPQQLLSALLFSPLKIANYLLGKVFKPINPVTKYSTPTTPHTDKHNQEEITTNISSQLEEIKQNQEKLSKQMNVMISGSHRKSEEMEILQGDLTPN